jgi:hypothetical protein
VLGVFKIAFSLFDDLLKRETQARLSNLKSFDCRIVNTLIHIHSSMEIQMAGFTICSLKEINKSVTMTDYLRNISLYFVESMYFLMIIKGNTVDSRLGSLCYFSSKYKPFSQKIAG